MKTAIAILTYNRVNTLMECMKGLMKHCSQYPVAVFEDAGFMDNTMDFLVQQRSPMHENDEIEAVRWAAEKETCQVYLGTRNLGVSGNSNRALKWFMEDTDCDHLCLCNDDILVSADFAKLYAEGHEKTSIGLFCLCPFDTERYKCATTTTQGVQIKALTRMTGIMMSITRELVEEIGYYDMSFGKFGEEHCDYTYRAGFAGFSDINGAVHNGIDIVQDAVSYQDAPTCIQADKRADLDKHASLAMMRASADYRTKDYYRPFSTVHADYVAGQEGVGIPLDSENGYAVVSDYQSSTKIYPYCSEKKFSSSA